MQIMDYRNLQFIAKFNFLMEDKDFALNFKNNLEQLEQQDIFLEIGSVNNLSFSINFEYKDLSEFLTYLLFNRGPLSVQVYINSDNEPTDKEIIFLK